jgi:predicted DNA-binding transcriptional regulator AlpA
MPTPTPRRLLSFKDLKLTRGIIHGRVHIRKLVAAGKFPAPIRTGERSLAWFEDEIDAYLVRQPRVTWKRAGTRHK